MLTPQDITEKGFVKAVFGGYDMEGVDEFLETVSTDYNALYKENAILKGKLKVLVEKVEEYRTTEDAMRMALLTAQRMGEEITVEATKAKDEMIQKTENEIKSKLEDTAKRCAEEEIRLAAAAKETAKFIELSQVIMRKHSEFLEKLESARIGAKPKGNAKQAGGEQGAVVKQSRSVKTAPAPKEAPPAKVAPTQKPVPVEASQPTPPVDTSDFEIDDIASQISSVVGQITEDTSSPAPSAGEAPTTVTQGHTQSLFEDEDESIKLYDPTETTESEMVEETSPRPKFDFDDLKFGANFDGDD